MTMSALIRTSRVAGGALTLLLVCGCIPMDVRTAYGPGVNYDRFGSTFAWRAHGASTAENQRARNETLDEFLRNTVTRGFEARGYTQQTEDTPDFLIDYGVVRKFRGGLQNSELSMPYEEGTLIINIYNARNGKYVWRGYASAHLDESASPATQKQRVTEGVRQILERFPKEGTQ